MAVEIINNPVPAPPAAVTEAPPPTEPPGTITVIGLVLVDEGSLVVQPVTLNMRLVFWHTVTEPPAEAIVALTTAVPVEPGVPVTVTNGPLAGIARTTNVKFVTVLVQEDV